ncbi:MAG TPA: hypothetical protein DCY20_10735 [Firmicutes bacterium]|nr:hypothetical protein [Bacillota bacterium]
MYFLKNYQQQNLGLKLGLLYLLNITDIIFTLMLIQTGLFLEANPLMAPILNNSMTTFLIKGILPAALFIYLYIRLNHATTKQLKISNIAILIMVLFYTLVNILHLIWFSLLAFIA